MCILEGSTLEPRVWFNLCAEVLLAILPMPSVEYCHANVCHIFQGQPILYSVSKLHAASK